jgi:hypothetical protein
MQVPELKMPSEGVVVRSVMEQWYYFDWWW